MTVNKRRKSNRHRGSRTCGWGLTHRGAGNRGGRGNAGSGKKGKCKMPKKGAWTIQYFGKSGFVPKGARYAKQYTINLRQLEELLEKFIKNKAAVLENSVYTVNLTELGVDKLLSSGKATNKFRIVVRYASKSAVEKVKAAGGEIVMPAVKKTAENKGTE